MFGHTNVGKLLRETISNMASSSKTIQKTSKCFNKKYKTRQILFYRFLREYTLFLIPSRFFLKGRGMEIPKILAATDDQFFKKISGQKRRAERKYKIYRSDIMFPF